MLKTSREELVHILNMYLYTVQYNTVHCTVVWDDLKIPAYVAQHGEKFSTKKRKLGFG